MKNIAATPVLPGALAVLAVAGLPALAPTAVHAAAAAGFNPEISLILQGRYAHTRDIDDRHIEGFPGAGHGHDDEGHAHGHGMARGFSLDHTELAVGANIDPYFRGFAVFGLSDGELEVEEAWVQTLGLGGGVTVKAGRFFSAIGYVNEQHPHAWDFADQSLAYQALFGQNLVQDGVQARWIAPTPIYLALGAEAGQGERFPGTERDENDPGAWAAFAHIGSDVGDSHSWRLGFSRLSVEAEDRESETHDVNDIETETFFTGDSKLWLADFVWKWAPDGNPAQRNFKFQAEYFQRRETGELGCEDNIVDGGACTGAVGAYRARQSGGYAQAIYQFHPNWRIGYRYDRLDPGHPDFGPNDDVLEHPHHHPERHTVMADYNPSEFSRIRLQYARDDSMGSQRDRQVVLQYIMSLGPHGAHRF